MIFRRPSSTVGDELTRISPESSLVGFDAGRNDLRVGKIIRGNLGSLNKRSSNYIQANFWSELCRSPFFAAKNRSNQRLTIRSAMCRTFCRSMVLC